MTKRTMWAVGPDDGDGWYAINAPTEDAAIQAYADEHDCNPDYIVASRVEGWDGLTKVTGPDWIQHGLGFSCTTCDTVTFAEEGGVVVNGSVYCDYCAPLREVNDA